MQADRSPDRVRVLLVDDDAPLLALVRLALAKEGLEVTAVESGRGCLDAFRNGHRPGLVILDVVLPDMSGWEVLRRLREESDVPVMLLSGRDSDVDKARGLDIGADDYLTKPFSFLELEARVRALLRRAHRAGDVPAGTP
jgi:DNA-binding response OmpR family regulator